MTNLHLESASNYLEIFWGLIEFFSLLVKQTRNSLLIYRKKGSKTYTA